METVNLSEYILGKAIDDYGGLWVVFIREAKVREPYRIKRYDL